MGYEICENVLVDKVLIKAYNNVCNTFYIAAEWSSPVARRAHNPKVVSSNLASAIIPPMYRGFLFY